MLKSVTSFISFFLIFSSYQNQKKEEIIITYSAISCSCAQWQIVNSKSKEQIYLEKNDGNVIDANKIWDGKTLPLKIKVYGSFKKEIGVPSEMNLKGNPKPARIFKYDKVEVLQYKKSK